MDYPKQNKEGQSRYKRFSMRQLLLSFLTFLTFPEIEAEIFLTFIGGIWLKEVTIASYKKFDLCYPKTIKEKVWISVKELVKNELISISGTKKR